MKNILKILFVVILTFSLMLGITNAETISSKFTINSTKYTDTPISFPQTFRVKKTTTGKYAYCIYYSMTPPSGQTYNKSSLVTDNGMNYILKQAYSADSNSDFFAYQTALWIYMVDQGIMPGDYNSVVTFKNKVNKMSTTTATKIKNLVSQAKKASKNDTSAPTISINTTDITFKLNSDKTKYVSNNIVIKSSTSDYTVSIDSAPSGTTYEKGDGYIRITVPASKVTSLTTTIKFSVNNTKTVYESYTYKSSDNKHQPVAIPFKDTKKASDSATAKLVTTKDVTISKQDVATSKELPGAKLELANSNGKVIDSWTSTTEPHVVKGLSAGTYTLTETVAPSGYVLSTEKITFIINSKGNLVDSKGNSISKVVMYNKKVTKDVTISKQDVATSKELPGAKLELANSNGKVIDSWTSTTEPHVVKGLSAGTYTLTETIAPSGYVLSTEKITFIINSKGKLVDSKGNAISKVVMYNKKVTKDIYISKLDITSSEELPGAKLQIKNSNGEVVDSWTSTTKPHTVKNLSAGTYTLTETMAPSGYVLSTEEIKFIIDEDGTLLDENGEQITKVIMYNELKKGNVSISKQDITTKKELPGASLIVKDYDGNVVDEWVSTDEPHIIENLKPGIYTLNEKVAPDGYILSDETITFTVNDDGTTTSVVMYNSPDSKEIIEVENTASNKSVVSTGVGLSIICIGLGLIFKNKKLV